MMTDFNAIKRALWETAIVGGSSLLVLLVFQIILTPASLCEFPVKTINKPIMKIHSSMVNNIKDNTTKELVDSLTNIPIQQSSEGFENMRTVVKNISVIILILITILNIICAVFTSNTLSDIIKDTTSKKIKF